VNFNLGNIGQALSIAGQNKKLADELGGGYQPSAQPVVADQPPTPMDSLAQQSQESAPPVMQASKGQDYINAANQIINGMPTSTNPNNPDAEADEQAEANKPKGAEALMGKLKTAAGLVASFYTGGAAGVAMNAGSQVLANQGEGGKKASGIMGMMGQFGGGGGGGLF
jgi:hypothetical protein